eukprot:scaffold1990_cov115-Skeletonema_dohrnii-CCMP3373.AAC.2
MTEKESSTVAAANSSYSEESKKNNQIEAVQPQLVPLPSPTSSQQQEKNDNETSEESPPPIDIDSLASARSLKDPKLIKGRRRHESPSDSPSDIYSTPIKQKSSSSPLTPETHKITITTISSAPSSADSVISDLSIQKACRQHKQTTPKSSGGALNDILEDVQFCGMYFCGEFLAINNNDNDDSPDDTPDDDLIEDNENIVNITTERVVTISKEERIKEMDDTFLGKMIQCGDIGDSCGTNGDYILFRPDDERNENFAPALRAHKSAEREESKACTNYPNAKATKLVSSLKGK